MAERHTGKARGRGGKGGWVPTKRCPTCTGPLSDKPPTLRDLRAASVRAYGKGARTHCELTSDLWELDIFPDPSLPLSDLDYSELRLHCESKSTALRAAIAALDVIAKSRKGT